MNFVQQTCFAEIKAAADRLVQSFESLNSDAFGDGCNHIIGLMGELHRDLDELIESSPALVPLAALMTAGRLPVMYAGEGPSD